MSRGAQTVLDTCSLVGLPIALMACALLQLQVSALLTLAVAIAALALFFIGWEHSQPGLRQILPTAVLVAAAVVGRIIFAAAPNIQPVTALCIIAGAVFGKRTGFMTGAMTGLVSSFFLGLGAWTPWQMYAWGLVGYVAGMAFCREGNNNGDIGTVPMSPPKRDKGTVPLSHGARCRSKSGSSQASGVPIVVLLAYGFVASFAFGLIMNTWTLVGFTGGPVSWETAAIVYGAGFAFDIMHALSTMAFLALMFVPLRRKLDRIALKYQLQDAGNANQQA